MPDNAKNEREETPRERGTGLMGSAVWGCLVAGFGGIAIAIWGLAVGQGALAGIPLAASAIAFGLLANAALRR